MGLSSVIGILYFITIIFIIFLIIKNNGEPVKTITWILVVLLIPVAGMIFYFFLGNNLRRNKLLNRKEFIDNLSSVNFRSETGLLNIDNQLSEIDSKDHHIVRLLANNSNAYITRNNNIQLLVNGEEIFRSIIECISTAEHHIHLGFFRILPGQVWNNILEVLLEKAKSGVKVRIIYDDVGSWDMKSSYTSKLSENGIDMLPFMPVFLPRFANKLNYRNHRKIAIIDGKYAFTGGFNIADHYLYGTKTLGVWHDVAIKIEGEAVQAIQKVFMQDWNFVKRAPVNITKDIFPKNKSKGNTPVQIVKSGPDSDWSTIMQSYFSAITSASDYVYLSTPYFLPSESILTALKTVALSNRTVKLLIPYKGDARIVNLATQSYISELLAAGIEIYLFNDGFNHGKFIIVDGRMCSIGTANIDIRSFDHDFEVNAFIYETIFAKQLEKLFLGHIEKSIKLTKESWDQRTKFHKFMNSFARILSPIF